MKIYRVDIAPTFLSLIRLSDTINSTKNESAKMHLVKAYADGVRAIMAASDDDDEIVGEMIDILCQSLDGVDVEALI